LDGVAGKTGNDIDAVESLSFAQGDGFLEG
jgi:hypothetical protein